MRFQPVHRLTGHQGVVLALGWHPDGDVLASGSRDRSIRIWNVATGSLRNRITEHQSDVTSLAWSAERGWLASGSKDQTVRIWDASLQPNDVLHQSSPIVKVVWSPREPLVAVAVRSGQVNIYDAESRCVVGGFAEPDARLSSITWTAEGAALLAILDGHVKAWSVPDGELVRIIDLGFRARDIACSKDGEWVAITGESPDVCVYSRRETPNGLEQVAMLEVEGQTFRQVAFGGDGNLLAAQSARKGIYVWSTDGWSFTDRISTPSMRAFHDSLAFCPSGPTFACLRQQKREIQVWRCVAEAEPPETDPTHEGAMPGTSATSPGALSIWQEKLDYLQQQEAIAAEPAQKFAIRKQIEEALQKIRELGQNS